MIFRITSDNSISTTEGTEQKQQLSVPSVFWYEKLRYQCFFMFIYEPQFIADSVVDYLVLAYFNKADRIFYIM
jgi:hypothetical protein